MAIGGDSPSLPSESLSGKEALNYYKSQYEQLEHELAEFQTSSRELEAELEKDIEASEKRERKLQEKVEALGFEVEEWKVGCCAACFLSIVCQIGSNCRGRVFNCVKSFCWPGNLR